MRTPDCVTAHGHHTTQRIPGGPFPIKPGMPGGPEPKPKPLEPRSTPPGSLLAHTGREGVGKVQDRVVSECVAALSHFSTEELREVAEHSEDVNPDGWLPKMIHEFIGVWR